MPSQSNKITAFYTVNLETKSCSCPDCTEGGFVCKHYYAASIVHRRDVLPDGRVIETKSIVLTERKTYSQDWKAYNRAQAVEKRRLRVLLQDLLRGVPELERLRKRGNQPLSLRDILWAMNYKVYCGLSARRFSTDLVEAHEMGFLERPIVGTSIPQYFERGAFTPILRTLVAHSARPLRAVERDFAIDSSGFGVRRQESWYDEKYGITRKRNLWVKAHVCSGVKTNCVTAVRILDKDSADSPQFVPLVKETHNGFPDIGEVSADKAYSSVENFEQVAEMGGQAYIAFKENATGGVGGLFEKAFHLFKFNEQEYRAHYHKRSNVESTFSAIKRKFGPNVMSRSDAGMVNEVLCKLICQNITCLIMEQETLGISPVFWKDEKEAERATILRLPASSA